MHAIWNDLFAVGIPVGEKIIRTLAVYVFLLAVLQLAGKRELGQLNPFDLVVLLLLSNAVQNAIIGNDNSLLGGMIGAITLLLANYLVVRFLYRHPKLDELIEGSPEKLIENGAFIEHALEKNLITKAEIHAAARRQGIEDLSTVACSRLEVGGTISFLIKQPTEADQRHDELMTRMEALETKLVALLERTGSAPAPPSEA
ncbi:MAG TPA: YetF domain-containing protein [Longimicrobiaceae bacterium]|jgi:uncharacterized membrane protein YcaP (DUF421 family)|nr:YetF domain-containing protein [Longimicrobiaceae bacterium]